MTEIADKEHQQAAGEFKRMLSDYNEAEDLINIGAYQAGSNPAVDRALAKIKDMRDYLQQGIEDKVELGEAINHLKTIVQ